MYTVKTLLKREFIFRQFQILILLNYFFQNHMKVTYRLQRNFQKLLRDYSTDCLNISTQIVRGIASGIIVVISSEISLIIFSGTPTGIPLLEISVPIPPNMLPSNFQRMLGVLKDDLELWVNNRIKSWMSQHFFWKISERIFERIPDIF